MRIPENDSLPLELYGEIVVNPSGGYIMPVGRVAETRDMQAYPLKRENNMNEKKEELRKEYEEPQAEIVKLQFEASVRTSPM